MSASPYDSETDLLKKILNRVSGVDTAIAAHDKDPGAHGMAGYEYAAFWVDARSRNLTGTGASSTNTNGFSAQAKTGTTANSTAAICAPPGSFNGLQLGVGSNFFDADKPFSLKIPINADYCAATGVARFLLGKRDNSANGALAYAGLGFELRNRALWGVAWDGALKEINLGESLVLDNWRLVEIRRIASGFEFRVDGTLKGVLACGSIGLLQQYTVPWLESNNGAGGGEHRVNLGPMCFRQYS